ncbi:hypothetical protein B0O99DRAFT_713186 [Bisporella sp. PMI_857]|nr:hypothetical protein B0O99DRAFT_713186 [Bisporella sp. PMI_857]
MTRKLYQSFREPIQHKPLKSRIHHQKSSRFINTTNLTPSALHFISAMPPKICKYRTASSYGEFILIYVLLFTIYLAVLITEHALFALNFPPFIYIFRCLTVMTTLLLIPFRGLIALGFTLALWNVRDRPRASHWQVVGLYLSAIQAVFVIRRLQKDTYNEASFFLRANARIEMLLMIYFIESVLLRFCYDAGYMDLDVWMAESTCEMSRQWREWLETGEKVEGEVVKKMRSRGDKLENIRRTASYWARQDKAFREWRDSGETEVKGIVREMLEEGYAINRLREIAKRV